MSNAVVTIHEGIIPWIRSIADPVAVSAHAAELRAWEEGGKPSVAKVDKMSKALHVPFGYFFLTSPYKTSDEAPSFRTLGSRLKDEMSPDLKDVVSHMELVQEWLKDEISFEDGGTSTIAGVIDADDDVITASRKIREQLCLDEDWFRKVGSKDKSYSFLRKKAGDAQVFIFESGVVGNNNKRTLNLEEFRAFALYDEHAPVVFINSKDEPKSKAFSLLHELVHIAIGQNDILSGSYNGDESFCNKVAAEIMVPESVFRRFWGSRNSSADKKLDEAASHFKCSISVVTLKAYRLGLIPRESCAEKLKVINHSIKQKSGGGDFYRTKRSQLDGNFLSMLNTSVLEGRTRYTEAYRLTGCHGKTYEALMEGPIE